MSSGIHILKNVIRHYEWGSSEDLSRILGKKTSGKPEAELWMGGHPASPSKIFSEHHWVGLDDYIHKHPVSTLGKTASKTYRGELPFLFKVLAAENPLSIQAHPSPNQAKRGFLFENRLGIPLGAGERNYKDSHAKPEMICALTPFWALAGFRHSREIVWLIKALEIQKSFPGFELLSSRSKRHNLRAFFQKLMTLDVFKKELLLRETIRRVRIHKHQHPAFPWILKLADKFPGDIGALSPLLLNLIKLEPGEAIALEAGVLHAYLHGAGLELMANSDNVLRGGLTKKHIDVPELLKVLAFKPFKAAVLRPQKINAVEWLYPISHPEFGLSKIQIHPKGFYKSQKRHSVEILFCTEGRLTLNSETSSSKFLTQGKSVFIEAKAGAYQLSGNGVLYKAFLPN